MAWTSALLVVSLCLKRATLGPFDKTPFLMVLSGRYIHVMLPLFIVCGHRVVSCALGSSHEYSLLFAIVYA